MSFSEKLVEKSESLGFAGVAIIPAGKTPRAEVYRSFIERGFQGDMSYLERHEELKADIQTLRPWVKSVVVFLYSYHVKDLPEEVRNDPSRGILAQYAWGPDYHDVLAEKLDAIGDWMKSELGEGIEVESNVGLKPISERSWAAAGGLGHIGRNGNLINYQWGSSVFIGELLVGAELEPLIHKTVSSCGFCNACKEACPTQAIVEDGVIDARKCLSYLTIELRGEIPVEYRKDVGNRILGCDICTQACPWNSKKQPSSDPFLSAEIELAAPELLDLTTLTRGDFESRYGKTPVGRAKYAGFMRNVAVALGNWGSLEAKDALKQLTNHPEALVRSHASWGLEQ